mmetsp:Transcript_59345/g.193580  ORF Transcript_59345/g.193580 Transcript_59345/m.193580 type:complete len:448 (+) Transcript_59345:1478-2821(+)
MGTFEQQILQRQHPELGQQQQPLQHQRPQQQHQQYLHQLERTQEPRFDRRRGGAHHDEDLSEKLSTLLRHKAVRRGVHVRADGLAQLLDVCAEIKVSEDQVKDVVQSSSKRGEPRFQLAAHGNVWYIRATTKHSLDVKGVLVVEPDRLRHSAADCLQMWPPGQDAQQPSQQMENLALTVPVAGVLGLGAPLPMAASVGPVVAEMRAAPAAELPNAMPPQGAPSHITLENEGLREDVGRLTQQVEQQQVLITQLQQRLSACGGPDAEVHRRIMNAVAPQMFRATKPAHSEPPPPPPPTRAPLPPPTRAPPGVPGAPAIPVGLGPRPSAPEAAVGGSAGSNSAAGVPAAGSADALPPVGSVGAQVVAGKIHDFFATEDFSDPNDPDCLTVQRGDRIKEAVPWQEDGQWMYAVLAGESSQRGWVPAKMLSAHTPTTASSRGSETSDTFEC